MKIWLKRLGLALLLVIVLIIAAGAVLLGTRPGVQWLLETADRFIPGELVVEHTGGNLLGDLQLQGVSYRNADMAVQVGNVVLSWLPSELFSGVFHLRELSVEQLRYEKLRETEDESAEALELPDIELPITLKLDLVRAKTIEIVSAPEAAPVVIDQVLLVAGWDVAGINLSKLDLAMPELQFQGRGHVLPKTDYPLALDMNWELSAEGLPQVSGQGELKGDLKALQLQHQIDGDVKAKLSASLNDVLHELGWEAKLQIARLPKAYLPLDESALLGIHIDAKGDLAQADTKVAFRVQAHKDAAADAAQQLLLNLMANIQFAEQRFKLQGDWQNLQWPLTGKAQVIAPSGKLQASGMPDGYVFSLHSAVQGDEIPSGEWQLEGKGDLNKLRLDKLLGNLLEGTLEAAGDLAWSPVLSWKMDVTATDINPEALAAEWPGKLNAAVSTSGELPETGLRLQAQIKELQGALREKPVAGSGVVHIDGDKLLLEEMAFSSGQAKVNVSGELGDAWNLDWKLDVADLADLLPGAEGKVQGGGKLRGAQEQPIVEGKLKAENLLAEGMRCRQCEADFSLGLDDAFVSRARITGADLLVAEQKVHTLSLKLDGPLQRHTVELDVDHQEGKLRFVATGAYLKEKTAWRGEIPALGLDAGELGNWTLQQPASLYASAEEIRLSPLCLQDQQTRLCAQVDRGKDKGNAKLNLKGLSLERLRPWLPPEITQLTGVLHLDATADLGSVIKANLEAILEPGELTYLGPQSKPIALKLHDGKIKAVYDEAQLVAEWMLGAQDSLLQGQLQVPRDALDKDPLTAPLKGIAKVVVKDLSLISAFVPDIQKIDGNIDVDLKLGGQLGNPRISGHAVLKSEQVVIPRAGLELKDILMQITGTGGQQLDITGAVSSGKGKLELNGMVLLDADKGWPARLTLKGDEFQLANLPEAQVVITPDLSLESSKDIIRIRGKLDVPVARIELHDLPAGTHDVSPDVVVVNEDGSVEEKADSKIDAEVVVSLGEDVHFSGFGLDADLDGRLTIVQNPGKAPTANGELKIESGSFLAYGQNLTIERGRFSYAGGRIDNPGLRLRASRKTGDITVGVEVTGTAKKPKINTFSSDPDMTEKDVVSMLLTGQKTGDLSEVKVYTGKQITPDLSVGVNLGGGEDGSEFVTRYRLMDNVNLEGTSSSKKSGVSINYTIELE
ncbi:translocation/assembly module TamB domain-containing protein [Thiolapillus sp.]